MSMIGKTLAHYSITAEIGRGGMGEVYQAKDTKLGRNVAIKVLPEAFAQDADRVARFQREAKLLASLNHPNIAAIHGLEESDGTHFLVLELIEGDTLAGRIKSGPIPVEEALKLALQIAEALEAAHEKGVIHRDLKPANIKVTPDGKVKVLDFGLAKAFAGEQAEVNLSHSPTLSEAATLQGVILGTAGYMPPEQAKGKTVDKRADIWAFGVVLFEMLAGRQVFTGETVSDTLASVLAREPEWKSLPPNLHPRIRLLLERCLEKEARDRYGSISDARVDIEKALADPSGVLVLPVTSAEDRRKQRQMLLWAITGLMTILSAIMFVLLVANRSSDRESTQLQVLKFTVPLPAQASLSADALAISPDGRLLTYAGTSEGLTQLWLHPLNSLFANPLPGTEGATFPFWSPDSRFIGFFAQGKLKKVEVYGGAVQTICSAPFGVGGSWSADGVIVFAPNFSSGLFRVSATGGEPRPVTTLVISRGEKTHRWPCFLPDGKHFVYFVKGDGAEANGLCLGVVDSNPETPARRLPSKADSMAVYMSPGYLLFSRNGTLVAQPFDLDHLQLSGDPVPIAEQLVTSPVYGLTPFTISSNGVLAYRSGKGSTQLTWFDRKGKRVGTIDTPSNVFFPDLSPNGNSLALERRDPDLGSNIWLVEIMRGTWQRFTSGPGSDRAPVWSPDGHRIVYVSNREGMDALYEKEVGGLGEAKLLVRSTDIPWDWSKDGQQIFYSVLAPKTGYDIWILPLDNEPHPVLQSPFNEWQPRLSPNGDRMAYSSDETGSLEVYIQNYPIISSSSALKWKVSKGGGTEPRWRKDAAELFYIAADGMLMAMEMKTGNRSGQSVPQPLFQTHIGGFRGYEAHYVVNNSGTRFLINTPVTDVARLPIIVEVNWAEELKERTPVD